MAKQINAKLKLEAKLNYNADHFLFASEAHFSAGTAFYEKAILDKANRDAPGYPLEKLKPELVRVSGHALWVSVLLASEALFLTLPDLITDAERESLYNVKAYQRLFSKIQKTFRTKEYSFTKAFNYLYSDLHLEMGYAGVTVPADAKKYFIKTQNFINKMKRLCEKHKS